MLQVAYTSPGNGMSLIRVHGVASGGTSGLDGAGVSCAQPKSDVGELLFDRPASSPDTATSAPFPPFDVTVTRLQKFFVIGACRTLPRIFYSRPRPPKELSAALHNPQHDSVWEDGGLEPAAYPISQRRRRHALAQRAVPAGTLTLSVSISCSPRRSLACCAPTDNLKPGCPPV